MGPKAELGTQIYWGSGVKVVFMLPPTPKQQTHAAIPSHRSTLIHERKCLSRVHYNIYSAFIALGKLCPSQICSKNANRSFNLVAHLAFVLQMSFPRVEDLGLMSYGSQSIF